MHETIGDLFAGADADLESDTSDAPVAENELTPFTSQVRITFHHTRVRLADLDGLSGKAAIDGLIEAGVLATDSPEQVAEVRTIQIKGKPEETKIVIEVID